MSSGPDELHDRLTAIVKPGTSIICVAAASAEEDFWADPRGEYLSAYHASEVYRLLGKKGLTSEASPPVGEAVVDSDVGYHNRAGGHSVEMFDWLKFLEFARRHLKNSK